ncbi:8151_t:CDS:2, partial [Ambispora leptoticha]
NIEEVDKGGFSVVYKTLYKKRCVTYEEVAIKIIKVSHKNKQLFSNELKAYHEFGKYRGISMDKNTGDFRDNFKDMFKLEWKIKLQILCDKDLSHIHSKNLMHRNLHS